MTALILIVIVIVGTLLLIRGLRGRRVGDTPYCPKCGYDLTGLTSHRCPECGRDFTPDTILRGRRHRRPGSVILGTLLLAIGVFALVGLQRNINWYRHLPFRSVLALADTGNVDAFGEVFERYLGGYLVVGEIRSLAEVCLKKHQLLAQQQAAPDLNWIGLLGDMHDSGMLTNDERQRFYGNIATAFEFEIRSPVCSGDPIPARLRWWQCAPLGWFVKPDNVAEVDLLVDNQILETPSSRRHNPPCHVDWTRVEGTGRCEQRVTRLAGSAPGS